MRLSVVGGWPGYEANYVHDRNGVDCLGTRPIMFMTGMEWIAYRNVIIIIITVTLGINCGIGWMPIHFF